MNLSEFIKAVAEDILEQAKSGATDIGYEAGMDTILISYRKFCQSFAQRYLAHGGTDHEVLQAFRSSFMRMLRATTITLDEIDAYLVGKYVDRNGSVLEIYMDANKIRKELSTTFTRKRKAAAKRKRRNDE